MRAVGGTAARAREYRWGCSPTRRTSIMSSTPELMDFCYVWLRRALVDEFDEFGRPSTQNPGDLTGQQNPRARHGTLRGWTLRGVLGLRRGR